MANVFNLDAMREDIERSYQPFEIQLPNGKTVTLRNILRVGKARREEVYKLLDEISDLQNRDEDSTESGLSATEKSAGIALRIFPLVADEEKLGRQLVEAIEDDLALTLKVFAEWMEGTQAGEAEGSQS